MDSMIYEWTVKVIEGEITNTNTHSRKKRRA